MESGGLKGTTLGHYRVDALIGRGGMGEVYRAVDTTLDRAVALKVLPQDVVSDAGSLARFVQAARSASALNHPNVVAIYQIGKAVPAGATSEVHYIAMELVTGETLRKLIESRRLDVKRSLEYMAQAADALAAAHAAGIIHRDFKPDNMMVAEAGYVKVLDFGLAKLRAESLLALGGSQATEIGTTPGAILGTVGYMSPEQAEGRAADYRSDIFSFGCVLYEVAAGVRAFAGNSSVDTLHRIIHADPEPITIHAPAAPPELQRIIRKCLAKNPDARYQSMKDVAIDLRELGGPRSAGAIARSLENMPPLQKTKTGTWLGATVAALILAAVVFAWKPWEPASSTTTDAPAVPMQFERLTGSGNVIDATVSPDGKYIAYVESARGEQSLWLRQLASTQALQLVPPAVVGYWGISFTKDSSSVYYAMKSPSHGGGQLFQIPILGGAPRPILMGIDSTVTFSPDGRQLAYYRENPEDRGSSSLMVANADGSNPRALVTKRPPFFFSPGFFVAPSWSPDGSQISGGVRNSDTRDAGLVVIDAKTGAERAFPTRYLGATFTSWLHNGSGLFLVVRPPAQLGVGGGGQIWLQPYPGGDPRPVTNDLLDYRNATVSDDSQSLVAVGTDNSPTLWLIPVDGTTEPQRIPSTRSDGSLGVAWMPDGRIVYTTRAGRLPQIAIMNVDGTNRQQLTVDGANAWPAVSSDGKTIVFAGIRGAQRGIWRMNPDGSAARFLAAVADMTYLQISPDDRTVYFTSAADGASSTWRVPIEGGTPSLAVSMMDRASISPDGRLAVGIYRSTAEGTIRFAVARLDDGSIVQIFSGAPLTNAGGYLQWTAEAKGFLFTSAERFNIWLQPLSGGAPTRVTNYSELTIFQARRSPNGRSILAARGNQIRDAFLITNFR